MMKNNENKFTEGRETWEINQRSSSTLVRVCGNDMGCRAGPDMVRKARKCDLLKI